MNEPIDAPLDACGCCESDPAPAPLYNRPGLPALSYRIGSYPVFFRRMLAELGQYILPDGDFVGTRPLLALTTRELDDPSIALLDASAVLADVLAFYQERIANEGFLRTATERRSILELARAIGYELNPGVAASAYLAFAIEDAMGAPGTATIQAGTQVQSVPPQGQLPQTFETSVELNAQAGWNALHPRLKFKQTISLSTTRVYLKGTATSLAPGDHLLLVDGNGTPALVQAVAVEAESDQKRTRVDFANPAAAPAMPASPTSWGSVDVSAQVAFTQENVANYIYGLNWSDSALNAFLSFNQWDSKQLRAFLSDDRVRNPALSGAVYALRKSVGFFGNNAPAFAALPSGGNITVNYGRNWDTTGQLLLNYWDGAAWAWTDPGMPLDDPVAGMPGAIAYLEGGTPRIYAFAQGANGNLIMYLWNGSGWSWADQGMPWETTITGVPSAVSYLELGQRRIYAFVRGTDGHLYVNYWNGSQWNWADQGLPPGSASAGSPAAVTYFEGGKQRIYTFVHGANGHLLVNYWNGYQWKWADQGLPPATAMDGTPAVITYSESGKQRIYAFGRGANGHLLVNYWDGFRWNWADQGVPPNTKAISAPSAITYLESGQQRIYVFVQGANGHLYVNYWNGSQWNWADQGIPTGTRMVSAPSAITYLEAGQQRIYAFLQGMNGHLFVNYWDGYGWHWSDQGAASGTTVTGAPSAVTYLEAGKQRIYVFAQSPHNWQIWMNQQAGDGTEDPTLYYYAGADVYLERAIQGLVKDSGADPRAWAAFETPGDNAAYLIEEVVEKSLGAFAMSGKATGLRLRNPDGSAIAKPPGFLVRSTTAYVQSEELELVEAAMDDTMDGDPTRLGLDGLVLGLTVGQAVAFTGERSDAPGVTVSEVLLISEINHLGGFTELTFQTGRQYDYKRSTLTINANVALATNGATVTEILGNGDGSRPNQRFTLKKPPLTYTAAPTPSGAASSLQVRINNLLWKEAASLYELGPKDQAYVVRIDDSANATVIFGDNQKGARLPTGANNVVATYRSGTGLGGEVDAASLTMLMSKPLGVRGVTNPLPAGGAADPETMDNARGHAPLTVRTLDRIVSVDDYQDFASAFAGIGKAQAVDLWQGQQHLVYLTIAGADGKPVTDKQFMGNFYRALEGVRDPAQVVMADTFDMLLFNLLANIAVDSRYVAKDVFAAIRAALQESFSFARRNFGQPVTAAEIMTVIQQIPGVIFVDLGALYLVNAAENLNQILTANTAYVDSAGNFHHAQLLLINTLGVTLQQVNP